MNEFVYSYPTKVYFGKKTAVDGLAKELVGVGQNVMLAYGGGSVKRNGVYDEVMGILKNAGKNVVEFGGIMPNPTYAKVQKAPVWQRSRAWSSFWPWAAAVSWTAARSSVSRR